MYNVYWILRWMGRVFLRSITRSLPNRDLVQQHVVWKAKGNGFSQIIVFLSKEATINQRKAKEKPTVTALFKHYHHQPTFQHARMLRANGHGMRTGSRSPNNLPNQRSTQRVQDLYKKCFFGADVVGDGASNHIAAIFQEDDTTTTDASRGPTKVTDEVSFLVLIITSILIVVRYITIHQIAH